VQVYEHDVTPLAGNGVVTNVQSVGSRVFALELFGSLTLLDVTWTPGRRHAALVPLATHRDQAWVQAFVPVDQWTVAAAVHAHALVMLRFDEARNYLDDTVPAEGTSRTLILTACMAAQYLVTLKSR
jgi:hypothetical protein